MKPILYNHTVPVFKEYKFHYPLNKVVKVTKQSLSNRLLNWVIETRFFLSIKRECIFWLKMIGFIKLN